MTNSRDFKPRKQIYAVTFETNRKNREFQLLQAIIKKYGHFDEEFGYELTKAHPKDPISNRNIYPNIEVGEF